jgi:threonyl-tRNA synthetase
MIKVTLPDGTSKEVEKGTNSFQIAQSISEGLARKVLAAEINGEIWDLERPLNVDVSLKLLTFNDQGGKSTMWHSSAHIMAEAIEFYYPGVKLAIGPPIENGFYYDIDFGNHQISESDLVKIEKKIIELAREKNSFLRKEISKGDAIEFFKTKNDPYKLELLSELEDGTITFYTQGNFTDLCKGPHLPHSGYIKAVKLLSIAGAYWRGNENNKQLTRIYGITFEKQKDLNAYLEKLEEAKKRDHRKLGKELELFTFSEKVGLGLPLWLPKGTELKERLVDFLKKAQTSSGYLPVSTPHIGHKDLYVCSGHYEKYGEDSFQSIKTPNEGE